MKVIFGLSDRPGIAGNGVCITQELSSDQLPLIMASCAMPGPLALADSLLGQGLFCAVCGF